MALRFLARVAMAVFVLARPTATLSLEAQERRERVQKLYGDD